MMKTTKVFQVTRILSPVLTCLGVVSVFLTSQLNEWGFSGFVEPAIIMTVVFLMTGLICTVWGMVTGLSLVRKSAVGHGQLLPIYIVLAGCLVYFAYVVIGIITFANQFPSGT